MTEPMTLRDEDSRRARDLADRIGSSPEQVVAQALRELDQRTVSRGGLAEEQRAELAALRALVEEARAHVVAGARNDHGWLYDWNGLPA